MPTVQQFHLDISKTAPYELKRLTSAVERERITNGSGVKKKIVLRARKLCMSATTYLQVKSRE